MSAQIAEQTTDSPQSLSTSTSSSSSRDSNSTTNSVPRLNKRKLAWIPDAPSDLGYADAQEEQRARLPRYLHISLYASDVALLPTPSFVASRSQPKAATHSFRWTSTPVDVGSVAALSASDLLAGIPLQNTRCLSGSRLALARIARGRVTAAAALSSAANSQQMPPESPSSWVPHPVALPARGTGSRGGRGRGRGRGRVDHTREYHSAAQAGTSTLPRAPGLARTSSATSLANKRTALQRQDSAETLGLPSPTKRNGRAVSPRPGIPVAPLPPSLTVNGPSSPGEDDSPDDDTYVPGKPRLKPSAHSPPASGPSRGHGVNRRGRGGRAVSHASGLMPVPGATASGAVSGSEYDSDASAASVRSTPGKRARGSRKRKVSNDTSRIASDASNDPAADVDAAGTEGDEGSDAPLLKRMKSLPALSVAARNLKTTAPKLHSPLSNSFTGPLSATRIPSVLGSESSLVASPINTVHQTTT